MNVWTLATVATLGGVVSALLGWLEGTDSFAIRKFMPSVLRAVLAGTAFAIGYEATNLAVSSHDLLIAFAGGAGIDVLGNRVAGVMKK